jgi:hypothetical protein
MSDFRRHHRLRRKSYNSGVSFPVTPVPPKPVAGRQPADRQPADNTHQHRHATYAAEATGLLLMAVLLLILTLISYWRYIPWDAR